MQRRMNQILTTIKEKSRVNYAKIATIGGFCDIDLIIIKATSPDDLPLPDRYIQELLKIFFISPSSFRAFSISFTSRFNKTQSWKVAIKCLLLLHRLLSSPETGIHFRTELFCSKTNGQINLHPCSFKDCSSSTLNSHDYTMFIRSYARLLDERMKCFAFESETSIETLIQELPQLQCMIDSVIDCKPNSEISRSLLIKSAMKYIIRDSFWCYITFRNEFVGVLDNLIELPYKSCQAAFDVYKKAALQGDQLCEYYDWCQNMGFCGSYEYPFVDRIPKIQIEALENFLHGMWQLTTECSSSSSSSSSGTSQSPSRSTSLSVSTSVEDENRAVVKFDDIGKKEGVEMGPLIQFDDDIGWEELLEASIRPHWVVPECLSTCDILNDDHSINGWESEIQLYGHPYAPFDLDSSQHNGNSKIGSQDFSRNPMYPWGL